MRLVKWSAHPGGVRHSAEEGLLPGRAATERDSIVLWPFALLGPSGSN